MKWFASGTVLDTGYGQEPIRPEILIAIAQVFSKK
jgi:hypothetical protein